MARMHLDPVLRRQRRGVGQAAQLGGARLAVQFGVAAGVQLDDRRAEADRRIDLRRIGLDEQRDAHPRLAQLRDDGRQALELPRRVDPALGRAFLALFGDDARRVRAVLQRDREHFVGRRHLQIERHGQAGREPRDIVVGDVPAILTQMRGDAVRPRLDRQQRRPHRVGIPRPARIAHRRDVIDVDAETQMPGHAARLPGLIAGIASSSGGKASGW